MATKRIVIEGDLVTVVTIEEGRDGYCGSYRRETTGKTVKIDDWLAAIIATRGEETFVPALADGRILARKAKGTKEVVVVEFPPKVRRIIEKVDDEYTEHALHVAFPWVYLIVKFVSGAVDRMYVFYRNDPAMDLGAEVCLPNLPNVYGEKYDGNTKNFMVCLGTISGMQVDWPLPKRLDWLVRHFWDSQFNRDLLGQHWTPSTELAGHPQSFREWEEKSRSDPGFILKIQWRPRGKTLRQILDEEVA